MEFYHGCQNSFIITQEQQYLHHKSDVVTLCHEYEMDGFIVFIANPLEMVLFNADGSQATMCGNGIRTFVKYGVDHDLIHDSVVDVITPAGLICVEIVNKSPFMARVHLSQPDFHAEKLSINTDEEEFFHVERTILGKKVDLHAVWTGTDHVVIPVTHFETIESLGPLISHLPLFRRGINVNFMRIISPTHIEVHTYERGVGWTRACGTGSSACVVVGRRLGLLEEKVNVTLRGGELIIEYTPEHLLMTGPAEQIV